MGRAGASGSFSTPWQNDNVFASQRRMNYTPPCTPTSFSFRFEYSSFLLALYMMVGRSLAANTAVAPRLLRGGEGRLRWMYSGQMQFVLAAVSCPPGLGRLLRLDNTHSRHVPPAVQQQRQA